VCRVNKGAELDLFIFVHIRSGSFELREFIRDSWGDRVKFPKVNVAFVLGRSKDEEINQAISKEVLKYGDIIQGDFTDVYLNLTYKALTWMRWVNDNCLNAKTLVKIDDDVVVNTKLLLEHINAGKLKLPLTSFRCKVLTTVSIVRDKKSPYYISFYEYEQDREFFEPFCAGSTIIISNDLIPLLRNLSYTTRDFRHDDVYLGMLGARVENIRFVDGERQLCHNCIQSILFPKDLRPFFFILNVKKMRDHKKAWRKCNY
jgi:hypothetical protein